MIITDLEFAEVLKKNETVYGSGGVNFHNYININKPIDIGSTGTNYINTSCNTSNNHTDFASVYTYPDSIEIDVYIVKSFTIDENNNLIPDC